MKGSLSINTITTESDSVENPHTIKKLPLQNYLRSGDYPDNNVGDEGKKASLKRYTKHFRFDAHSEALYCSEKPFKPDNVVLAVISYF